jgi:hypothetical protein
MGFLGVACRGLAEGSMDQIGIMIIASLVVSLIGFELSRTMR